jgi:hypothetical protein
LALAGHVAPLRIDKDDPKACRHRNYLLENRLTFPLRFYEQTVERGHAAPDAGILN